MLPLAKTRPSTTQVCQGEVFTTTLGITRRRLEGMSSGESGEAVPVALCSVKFAGSPSLHTELFGAILSSVHRAFLG